MAFPGALFWKIWKWHISSSKLGTHYGYPPKPRLTKSGLSI